MHPSLAIATEAVGGKRCAALFASFSSLFQDALGQLGLSQTSLV